MEVRLYEFVGESFFRRVGLTYMATGHYVMSRYTAGPFELVIPASAAFSMDFTKDRIVFIDRIFWGIITGRKINQGIENTVTVTGQDLKELFSRRQIVPDNMTNQNAPMGYDNANGSTETVIKHYVNNHAVNPKNPARKFGMLKIAPDKGRGIEDDAYYARYVNLLDTAVTIGKRANLGITITGSEKTMNLIFDVAERVDRTYMQGKNRPLILDVSNHNVDAMSYTEDQSQSGNVFYCSRSGDEYEWETLTQTYFQTDNEPVGLARREKSLSISVYEDGDQYEQLEKNARKEMTKYLPAESLTCTMSRNLIYGKDYNVGDYVTLRYVDIGMVSNMEIVSVDVVIDSETTSYVAEFGEPQLNRFQKIARGN